MCERFDLCLIDVAVDVDALGFFRKYDRYVKMSCNNTGDTDTGSLDGHDLIDICVGKAFLEFSTHFIKEGNVHLVIQKLSTFVFFYNSVSRFVLLKSS